MKMLLPLLTLLISAPYEEAPQEDPAQARACAALDAKVTERHQVLHAAEETRDRAAVRYHDAVEAKGLPKRPTPAQVKAVSEEVLAAWHAKAEAERALQLARDMLGSMQAYVEAEKKRLGCIYRTPRG